jgi:hypothetical protein
MALLDNQIVRSLGANWHTAQIVETNVALLLDFAGVAQHFMVLELLVLVKMFVFGPLIVHGLRNTESCVGMYTLLDLRL